MRVFRFYIFVCEFDPSFFNNLKFFHFPEALEVKDATEAEDDEDEDHEDADEDEDKDEDSNDNEKVGNITDNFKIVCI